MRQFASVLDVKDGMVTLQSGATVHNVLEKLAPHGLTLQNLASIAEQTIAGWAQAGCHGNGATLPPIEEQIVGMKLATPGQGLLVLSDAHNKELFSFAKVGLGCLGIVTELTLKCVPAHRLVEKSYTCAVDQVDVGHADRLRQNRHAKYLWIPHTQQVVVLTAHPPDASDATPSTPVDEAAALAPARQLLAELAPSLPARIRDAMGFTKLRSRLLAAAPLDQAHVKRVNEIEAQYWAATACSHEAASENILQFDCGGQQLVFEIAFQTGTLHANSGADLRFMAELLDAIHRNGIPAPAPIEQRWTARSTAAMSPAYSADPDALFCWVGIIMYLPGGIAEEQRAAITAAFEDYSRLMATLSAKYGAFPHWAKLELPVLGAAGWRERIRSRFPVDRFLYWKRHLDPHGVLGNALIDQLFPPAPASHL